MPEQGRISARQMASTLWIMYLAVVVLVPSLLATLGRDAWLAELSVNGLEQLILLVNFALAARFPGKTLVQIARAVFGPSLGSIVAFIYVLLFFFFISGAFRSFADFILSSLIPETPIGAILLPLGLLAAYAAKNGIESIVRSSTILVPFFTIGILMLFFALPEGQMEHLLPIGDTDWAAFTQSVILTAPVFAEAAFMPTLSALTSNRKTLSRTIHVTLFLAGVLSTLMQILAVVVFGDFVVSGSNYPIFAVARQVSIGGSFERVEAVFMTILTMGYFVRTAFFLYAIAFTTAEIFNLRDYRPLVLAYMGFIAPLSVLQWSSQAEVRGEFLTHYGPTFFWVGTLGLPLLTWIVGLVRSPHVPKAKSPG